MTINSDIYMILSDSWNIPALFRNPRGW